MERRQEEGERKRKVEGETKESSWDLYLQYKSVRICGETRPLCISLPLFFQRYYPIEK